MTTIPGVSAAEAAVRQQARKVAASLAYATGFGNEHSSEAVQGALPVGLNTPQRSAHGLYTELLSVTGFTELRQNTQRTWMYRMLPSVTHPPFEPTGSGSFLTPPFEQPVLEPNHMYWEPRPAPEPGTDFLAGLWTIGGNGDPLARSGVALHLYTANQSMSDRVFGNADGEMLIIPEHGGLLVRTELGVMAVEPGHMALIPRAMKFRVEIMESDDLHYDASFASGYCIENFGMPFKLPELGIIGHGGLANARDFRVPRAAYDDPGDTTFEVVHKFGGRLFRATYDHSPLDVVAWHGTAVPFVYNMLDFQVLGALNFDHPDPSLLTALSSLTSTPGVSNIDFCISPPRWVVTEGTFRGQYFHRNISSEFFGVIYPRPVGGAVPGCAALTQMLTPHGLGRDVWQQMTDAELIPQKALGGLFFLIETNLPILLTQQAADALGDTDDEMLNGRNTLERSFRPEGGRYRRPGISRPTRSA
jgi:homogentisate 1,2-dioxygenase